MEEPFCKRIWTCRLTVTDDDDDDDDDILSVFSLQNAVCFIILTYLVPVLFTFCIQGVVKLKIIPAPKG